MTDDCRSVMAQGQKQITQGAGMGPDRVVTRRRVGLAMAGKIGGDDRVVARERRYDVPPGRRVPPRPCMSSTAGPVPATVYAIAPPVRFIRPSTVMRSRTCRSMAFAL